MTKLETVGAVREREREKHLEIGALLFNSLTHTIHLKIDVSFAYPKIRNKK